MSFENLALYGYYTKCGVPDHDAEVISSLFGGDFIHLQAEQRQQGAGKKAKALAAVYVSDGIFVSASFLWEGANTVQDAMRVVRIVRSAGICSVGVYAYALDQDMSQQCIENFSDFLRTAKSKISSLGGEFDVSAELENFKRNSTRLGIASAALGGRKGFFSKIFG